MTMPDSFPDGRGAYALSHHTTFTPHAASGSQYPSRLAGDDLPLEFLAFPDFEDIHYHLMGHPVGMHAIHGYDGSPDWERLLDCGCEPDDQYQKMRWKHTREAFESIKPFLKEREEMLKRYKKERGYQATLAQLRKRDPLYERTMAVMEHIVGELPQVVKEICMPVMAREFGPFLRLYAELREVAEALENHGHHRKRRDARRARAGGSGTNTARPSGSTTDRQLEWSREAERRELVERVKAGGARDGDLLRYMELQAQDRQARG